jgi:hypothetical protein
MKMDKGCSLILWRTDLLLGKDLKTNDKTTAIAMQWHSKHTSTTTELLLEMAFSTRSMLMSYDEDNWGNPVSCQFS